MIDEETAQALASLLFVREIRVDSDKIKEVILSYPYRVDQKVYPLTAGRAFVPVYDSACKILLGDGEGSRYTVSVEHRTRALFGTGRLVLMIAPFVRNHLGYAIHMCYEYQNTLTVQEDNVDLFALLARSERIEEDTRRTLRRMLVDFYYEKDRMRELDDYLLTLRPEEILPGDRREVVRCMVNRGMYEEAYEWVSLYGPYRMDAKTLLKLCSRLLELKEIEDDPVMTGVLFYVMQKGKYDDNVLHYLVRYFNGSIKQMRDVWKAAEAFGVDTYGLCERMLVQMLYTGAHVGEKIEILRAYDKSGGNERLRAAFLSQCCYDYAIGEQITEDYVFESVLKLHLEGALLHIVCKIACLRYYAENRKDQTDMVKKVCVDFLSDLLAEQIVLPLYKEYQGYLPQMDAYLDKTMVEYRVRPGSKAVIHYVIQSEGGGENEYCKEEMRDMFGGICVKEFVLFFGEKLQYYITEETGQGEQVTKSGAVSRSDIGQENLENRFSMLNDIMIGRTLQDYDTVDSLLFEYYRQDHMVEQIFMLR